MSHINWKNKCWVTTIFLVHNNRVLLTWNKNVQTWIPVGGHIDEGETPQEAIRREVAEETGFEFEFVYNKPLKEGAVDIVPLHRVHIDYPPHHGAHINFVFIGKCTQVNMEQQETDEQEKLKWFTEEEIRNDPIMLESIQNVALEALKQV